MSVALDMDQWFPISMEKIKHAFRDTYKKDQQQGRKYLSLAIPWWRISLSNSRCKKFEMYGTGLVIIRNLEGSNCRTTERQQRAITFIKQQT